MGKYFVNCRAPYTDELFTMEKNYYHYVTIIKQQLL